MSSSNPSLSQFGLDAMGSYFMASHGGMLSAGVPPSFQGTPPPDHDHGEYGLGDAAATDIGAQFASNNLILASLASQLFGSAAAARGDHLGVGAGAPPVEEMNGGFDVPDGGSPVVGSLTCHGQSDAHAWALSSSSSKKSYGDWSNANGSRAVTVHGSYQLAGPPEAAGLYLPLVAGYCAPAASDLSPRRCSKSSSDSMSMAKASEQFSSGASASRSGLPPQVYCPQAILRPMHFAVVVARSPYAPVAQQMLNDVVGHVLHGVADDFAVAGADNGSRLSLQASSCSAGATSVVSCNNVDGGDAGARVGGPPSRVNNQLLKMLQLMDQAYNKCVDEIQRTTARFNGLMPSGGGSNGSICAAFAHRAVSAAFLALRRRITGEMMAAGTSSSRPARQDSSMTSGGEGERERSQESAFIQKHLAVQQLRRREQQYWRPQRGLPEKSVAVLKSWMFENFVRPYPQDSEKDMLAARSGLTRNQVSNWFINARVRLWRPLIEELHEELRRSCGG